MLENVTLVIPIVGVHHVVLYLHRACIILSCICKEHVSCSYVSAKRMYHVVMYRQGADPMAINDKAQTPLYCAVEQQHPAAVQCLSQDAPAAVNKADEWGLTQLHVAARLGHADSIRLLLNQQVRVCHCDKFY